MSDNKRIAKNTIYLYIRMILIMGVTLFTSRVILDKLGVVDYGLYNVVGSVVGMLSFINGTVSIGTSRFITYEIGTGNKQKLWQTFNTSFYAHLSLSVIILVFLETVGLWFFYNKLVIPEERIDACFWVYQLSLFTAFVSITQVPYTALVESHEHFDTYAYVSVFEALAKLGVCYMVVVTSWDKLIIYALLIALIQIVVAMYYRFYCNHHFEESHLSLTFDRTIFRGLMGFSGWNMIANVCEMLKVQGVIVIINLFLSPVVVAAQAISNQVSSALMNFVNNFRIAFNPQIIKLYAANEKDASKKLTLQTTVICFDMLLVFALPCIYTMKTLMGVWLVDVPDYAVIFTQYILVNNIICTFNASFYVPMMAANKIKFNSICSLVFGFLQYSILYVALYLGGGPMWVPSLFIVSALIFSLFVKPYVLWKEIDYSFQELLKCYWECTKVAFLSIVISCPFVYLMGDSICEAAIIICITVIAVCVSSFVFMEKQMRDNVFRIIRTRIFKVKR